MTTIWNPPKTTPKDRAFMITTAGPQVDFCFWDKADRCFKDYFHKQRIPNYWPYMIAWAEMPPPAKIGISEDETFKLNGWEK